jgi:hypothetical protein
MSKIVVHGFIMLDGVIPVPGGLDEDGKDASNIAAGRWVMTSR